MMKKRTSIVLTASCVWAKNLLPLGFDAKLYREKRYGRDRTVTNGTHRGASQS